MRNTLSYFNPATVGCLLSTFDGRMPSPLIKVCGMREPVNLSEIEMLDVDFLGFIFYSQSLRYVPENHKYVDAVRRCKKTKIGVFVDESVDKILAKAKLFQLNGLQLHGSETVAMCRKLRQHGYFVIKTFPVATTTDFQQTERYINVCDFFLFDTKCTGYGGSGTRFDWSLLKFYQGETPFLLSGGLTPDCADDIKQLIHLQFVGIDLNSGFETSPAMKDVVRLKDFIHEIR